jgi:hypothetical protein
MQVSHTVSRKHLSYAQCQVFNGESARRSLRWYVPADCVSNQATKCLVIFPRAVSFVGSPQPWNVSSLCLRTSLQDRPTLRPASSLYGTRSHDETVIGTALLCISWWGWAVSGDSNYQVCVRARARVCVCVCESLSVLILLLVVGHA